MSEKSFSHPLRAAQRIPLVGRKKKLQEILNLFERVEQPTVYYLEGPGGVGKTAILEAALERAREMGRGKVAARLLDLYHVDYQSPVELAEGIYATLGRPKQFSDYLEAIRSVRQRMEQGTFVSQQEIREAWRLFAEALSSLAKEEGPVLLALDTLEVLGQAVDPFQADRLAGRISRSERDNIPSVLGGGGWLFELFEKEGLRGPILWLWAGRKNALLRGVSEKVLGERLIVRHLRPLEPTESQEYLRRVAERLEDEEEAERILAYVERYGNGLYRGTRGDPILLAMVADILRIGMPLPNVFYTTAPIQEREREVLSSSGERGGVALDRTLMWHLLGADSSEEIDAERGYDPVRKTLQVMGVLRKGANASLLSRLLDVSEEEAAAYLHRVARLSIVKQRPQVVSGEESQAIRDRLPEARLYFLHDELYRLFDQHHPLPDKAYRELLEKVLPYYEEGRKQLEKSMHLAIGWERVQYGAHLEAFRAEELHYRMRLDPREGFETYFFRWAEDALDGRNRDADVLLHNEIMRTVGDLQKMGRISEALRRRIEVDAAIRWGIRFLLIESNLQEARELLQAARQWVREKGYSLQGTALWHLELYEAVIALRLGEYTEAREKLEQIVDGLERAGKSGVVNVLRAFAEAYLGYLERLQGAYYQAVDHYQAAVAHYRRLEMGALVSALANLAYAMAMVGRFRRARQVLDEAERKARGEQLIYWLAVTLNVRCIVEAMDGHSRTAIRHADDALRTLEGAGIEDYRLQALIYTNRARAYRYYWNSLVVEGRWREQKNWKDSLWQAYEDIRKARNRFKWAKIPLENPYYLEMSNEAGCIYREMAWFYRRSENRELLRGTSADGDSYKKAFDGAKKNAVEWLKASAGLKGTRGELGEKMSPAWEVWKQAIEQRIEAVGGDPYLPTLALVNLGWHWHYWREDSSKIAALCELVEQLIPPKYHLPDPQIKREEARIMLWSVLGKMEMLRFHETLRGLGSIPDDEGARAEWEKELRRGVRAAVYALEYNHLMGDATYDLQRAEIGLNQRLLSLPYWRELLPALYRLEEKITEELEEFLSKRDKAQTTFRRWLAERFGDRSLWLD